MGMGWFIAGTGAIIAVVLLATAPAVPLETAVFPPLAVAHVGLAIIFGGVVIGIGLFVGYEGFKGVRESRVIPWMTPQESGVIPSITP